MKPASRSSSYEVGRQVIAAAQVREALVDFAGRLGLYRPLPRAQELGLLPSVDDAGGVLEPHARRECTASGLSLYFSRRHRQLADISLADLSSGCGLRGRVVLTPHLL